MVNIDQNYDSGRGLLGVARFANSDKAVEIHDALCRSKIPAVLEERPDGYWVLVPRNVGPFAQAIVGNLMSPPSEVAVEEIGERGRSARSVDGPPIAVRWLLILALVTILGWAVFATLFD